MLLVSRPATVGAVGAVRLVVSLPLVACYRYCYSGVGGGGVDIVDAVAERLASGGQIELPGARARFAEGSIGAENVGAAVDADAETITAGEGAAERRLRHVRQQAATVGAVGAVQINSEFVGGGIAFWYCSPRQWRWR